MAKTLALFILLCFCDMLPSVQSDVIKIPVKNKVSVNCSEEEYISTTNVTLDQLTTKCHHKSCDLIDIKAEIDAICQGKRSCELSANLSDGCLQEYGFFDFFYFCNIQPIVCNFENDSNDACPLRTADVRYHWKISNGEALTSWTGPDADHTTSSILGHYMYADDSYSFPGDSAIMTLNNMTPNVGQCLSFWYHMYGTDVGFLTVYQSNGFLQNIPLWTIKGNQEKMWHQKKLILRQDLGTFHILFEAVRGRTGYGDIAIDDITVTNTNCEVSEYDCDFTNCSWEVNTNKKYKWVTNAGNTHSTGTGPKVDHTTGSADGKYMYLDAFGVVEGAEANLSSFILNIPTRTCFSFWYHMFGSEVGSLAVYIENDQGSQQVWNKSGDKGNWWLQALIELPPQNDIVITLLGTHGVHYRGDIAVDDFTFTSGFCSGCKQYVQTCSRITSLIHPVECSSYYIDHDSYYISYGPQSEDCVDIYGELQYYFRQRCNGSENYRCAVNFSDILQSHPECFVLNKLTVEYTCQAIKKATIDVKPYMFWELIAAIIGSVLLLICSSSCLIFLVKRHRGRKMFPPPKMHSEQAIPAPTQSYVNSQFNKDDDKHKLSQQTIYLNTPNKDHLKDTEGPYMYTGDGTYDTSKNIWRKNIEENVYSHTVDNVYDTSTSVNSVQNTEDSYDHCPVGLC